MPDHRPAELDAMIARIVAGDRDAFAALYRACRPDVFRFARHMCGSAAPAEDIVQDVFLAVIEHATRYQPGRSGVVAWLLGIASNHVRRWRHRRIWLPLPAEASRDGRHLISAPDPAANLARGQHDAALGRAIVALPLRFREVVVLCDLQELSYEDAANALGCRVGTVRSRLHRGRARLSATLGELKHDASCRTPAAKQL